MAHHLDAKLLPLPIQHYIPGLNQSPDFGVVALYNLLALYGFELAGTDDVYFVIRRLKDGRLMKSRAWTLDQWIRTMENLK